MKDLRKAAERLLEALDDGWVQRDDWAAFELRQALAQPEREWVGLTDEEIVACGWCDLKFAKNIEAKLKEKNT